MAAELVVCRFAEDVSWTDRWTSQRVIYNKGADDLGSRAATPLENVGNEGDAYLRHILSRYPDFPQTTVFSQGRVDDHADAASFVAAVDAILRDPSRVSDYVGLSAHWGVVFEWGDARHAGESLPIRELWDAAAFDLTNSGTFHCNYNGMFAVSREALLRHPRECYERLLAALHERGRVAGFALERLWTPMFDNA